MKKRLALILIAVSEISFAICGCDNGIYETTPVSSESSQNSPETSAAPTESIQNNPESAPDSTEPDTGSIVVIYDRPAADYEYQLWLSDDVILGEVVEELEGRYSNPDGALKEVGNSWVTPYRVRIDKSYKGVLSEGETVIVDVWRPKDDSENIIYKNYNEFYLHEGQRGIFMLDQTKYITYDNGETMYGVVFGDEGLFEPKEESEDVYASPSFEVTLDQISADVAKADEVYGERDKTE